MLRMRDGWMRNGTSESPLLTAAMANVAASMAAGLTAGAGGKHASGRMI
jgi:hypothetical protein